MSLHKQLRKIIYFDRETIQNILQEKNKGSRIKTSGTSNEAEMSVSANIEASGKTNIGVPFLARLKFAFTGELDARYLLKHDSTTTITSTEISEFESIQDSFVGFENQQVYDIENSSTFFRVAGGYLKMLGNNIEGVNVKEFQSVMNSFEGYDVYKINNAIYVRFNNTAFVSNYKRNDLLTTKISIYCVPVGRFSSDNFDFMKQLTKMQALLTTTNAAHTISDIYPPAEPLQGLPKQDEPADISNEKMIDLYDVVFACVAQREDATT